MLLILFAFEDVKWTCNFNGTRDFTFPAGLYEIKIQGARGGDACNDGSSAGTGGNGAKVSANVRIRGSKNVTFVIGGTPEINTCDKYNKGGTPGQGGDGGNDNSGNGNDYSGGGGGYSEMKDSITDQTIMLAGGGSGGCGSKDGGYGGTENSYGGYINGYLGLSYDEHQQGRRGGKGTDRDLIPGAGGGGGYYGGNGGYGTVGIYLYHYYACGFGGSSYYDKTNGDNSWFDGEVKVEAGIDTYQEKNSHGCYQIKTLYKCIDHCYDCRDDNTCLTCESGYIKYNNRCYSSCPEKTFYASNTCVQCHSSCQTCSGTSSDQCTSCPAGKILWKGQCLPSRTMIPTPLITPIYTPYGTPFLTAIETPYDTPYLTNA
ncbi:WAG22 antigen precursor, putative [Trichomonas vaginalis G3]|uniref:receptor protein-tyrosine kinase n=1 Tax=Trichomonas vaginalis (strain ATCC PRA-98 / G3) TaxID=412133 RepID=A2DUP7_TRIV3|nr:serine-type endopeptidase protein [Trichomonas vaginalis G3]EAY15938.1 WAG22 antigen precursor, putative [Trichomonas vaginalis G3]KAI5506601.1 serine-type endopeptidase protein [Trichomonas vaginalis G3]|eukprot:XP_001328161.1 WAG22 antigen precursor [Trichomonas vaginalis G3]